MSGPRSFPLEPIRTDGWFERIGEGIGSFQALCDIIGARFFAFAMITGARITALTVDRREPDNTIVDFVLAAGDGDVVDGDSQRVTLGDFRRRLVEALTTVEPAGPPPLRATDLEALQLHIGVRYLLLAPLYGYGLQELSVTELGSELQFSRDGSDERLPLEQFRARVRAHVREELHRLQRGNQRGAIELSRVAEAERAAAADDHVRVLELLGAWPAPLAIFLRTPEGQLLNAETRALIAKGLGLLGSSCIALDEVEKGEEVLRLAVQYARDDAIAADIYFRLGSAMLRDGRGGEAIGPLRRAVRLNADAAVIWPMLADAWVSRERWLAAWGAVVEARQAGATEERLAPAVAAVRQRLGAALEIWEACCARK